MSIGWKSTIGLVFLFSSARAYANPQLTLNKAHEPGTIAIGAPITYLISISNSGDPNAHVSVTDTLPSGFVFVTATCTATIAGAACPSGPLVPPTFGEFSIPNGGSVPAIELRISGYFKTGGPKTNSAVATAEDDNGNPISVCPPNTVCTNLSQDSVTVPFNLPPVDLKVEKCVKSGSACVSSNATSFPATMHYVITVTNKTADDVYLGGLLTVRDTLSNISGVSFNWSVAKVSYQCTPSNNAVCPDNPFPLSGTLPVSFSTQFGFVYDKPGESPANDGGFLPGNASYAIEFDVDATTTATCKKGTPTIGNQAFLSLSNGSQSFSDPTPGDNTSQQVKTTISTTLLDCPPAPAPLQVSKVQVSPAGNTANWSGTVSVPVKYRMTLTNPANGAPLTNVSLSDGIFKDTGTPTFKAMVTSGPTCASGCTMLVNVVLLNPAVSSNAFFYLWTATLPSLATGQQAEIEYEVTYTPECETDPRPDRIHNYFAAGTLSSQTQTTLPEAAACDLKVEKTTQTAGPIFFDQPFNYRVVYSNLSAAPVEIGTVRDVVSISSSTYGTVPFNYSVSCAATAGTIVSLTPPTTGTITPLPGSKNATGATTFKQHGWQGTRLLDEALKFGPGAVLTCDVIVTAHKPADTNPFCQGAGNPQLVNSAYMDVNRDYNENDPQQPAFYSSQATDLPLCRNLIVSKTANAQNFTPGAGIVYTITVENKGNHAVDFFTLKDVIQPPLSATGVTPCNPASACTAGPTLSANQVDVTYGLLPPNQPVSFDISVTAPQAGGSYPNLAQGSFLPGGNFYFQGDEEKFLQQEENIQVVTPTLAKSFAPGTIGPNGTATLLFIVTNTNGDPQQIGISFSDTLSSGLLADSVSSNGCGGAVSISLDGRTITLIGGQLSSGSHTCQIQVTVKAIGICGAFSNKSDNFSSVTNLDVSGISEQMEVAGCPLAECTGGTPAYGDPGYAATFTGQVAVATCFASQSSDPVLVVIDLKNQAAAPLDTSWDAASIPPTAFYHAANWTKANLGNVFGLTLDDGGNIYLTATSSYAIDAYGPAGPGGIYRIDGTSGAITTLPPLANTGASLGNIHFDASYDSFYVTNFDDGLIMRLDHAGAVLGQWDHGANLPFNTPPAAAIPDDPVQSFTPLGRRVWGVHTLSSTGRLYYSVWWEDEGSPDSAHANEIWSVALDATGDFVQGTAQLEVTVPPLSAAVFSNPVADINFGPTGNMLLAERSMGDLTNPSAHQSRGLEYLLSGGTWMPSPNIFEISELYPPGSAAGGVDQDFAPGGRVWFTGDALHLSSPDNIYGLQALPATGGSTSNSILIDLNGDVANQNKTEIGDVSVSCPSGAAPSPDIDVLLTTGRDETSGTRLPRGTADDDWTVAVGGGPAQPALLVAQPPSAWPRFRPSEWISATASGASQPGALTMRFERCFCLAADATNAKLMLQLWADDQATVLLNGLPIAGPGGQFRRAQPLSVLYMGMVGSSLFQPGNNCVAVDVDDIRLRFIGLDIAGSVWVDHGKCAGASY